MKIDLFQSCGHLWVFQICWHIECSTFTASSFRIWNSSTGIASPQVALFIVMLPKANLSSHSGMSDSRWVWVITPSWLSVITLCDIYGNKMEKEMATHSSILAWRIPGMGDPVGLLSMGSHRVGHDWSYLACLHALEKELATPSSILAWRIPGTEEPGGLLSMRSHRVGHNWSDLAAAAAAAAKTIWKCSSLGKIRFRYLG